MLKVSVRCLERVGINENSVSAKVREGSFKASGIEYLKEVWDAVHNDLSTSLQRRGLRHFWG